jgi:hypothetical protein
VGKKFTDTSDKKKLTVVELSQFVAPRNFSIRKLILEDVDNYEVVEEWKYFDESPRRERESYVEAVGNRANKFTVGENVRRIFGQAKSTIDFRKAMDKGKIILCNLARGMISEEEQRMLGVVIVDKIVQAGMSRIDIPEYKRRPFYFYLDEFGLFVSRDIADALQSLRKFNVLLILSHQELEQLREDDRKVFAAVMGEPQIKMSFRTSREDAEIMLGELFTGRIRGDREKRRIEQTKFWPKESTRVIETDSDSWAEFESETMPGFSLDITRGEGSTYGGSHNRTVTPFMEQIPFREVSSIEDYSIQEMSEKYISWIKNQPDRHAQLKIRNNRTIPIVTPDVNPAKVRQRDIEELKEKVYRKYAIPASEADRLIEERRLKFIEEAEALEMLGAVKLAPQLTPESMRQNTSTTVQPEFASIKK